VEFFSKKGTNGKSMGAETGPVRRAQTLTISHGRRETSSPKMENIFRGQEGGEKVSPFSEWWAENRTAIEGKY